VGCRSTFGLIINVEFGELVKVADEIEEDDL
jgi:hypothetical protein